MYKQIALALSIGVISLPVLAWTTPAQIERNFQKCVETATSVGAASGCTYHAAEAYKKLMTPAQRKVYASKEKACDAKASTGSTEMDIANSASCMHQAAKSLVKKK